MSLLEIDVLRKDASASWSFDTKLKMRIVSCNGKMLRYARHRVRSDASREDLRSICEDDDSLMIEIGLQVEGTPPLWRARARMNGVASCQNAKRCKEEQP
jgi:hypothetical protein